jgi:hypothetical protein
MLILLPSYDFSIAYTGGQRNRYSTHDCAPTVLVGKPLDPILLEHVMLEQVA